MHFTQKITYKTLMRTEMSRDFRNFHYNNWISQMNELCNKFRLISTHIASHKEHYEIPPLHKNWKDFLRNALKKISYILWSRKAILLDGLRTAYFWSSFHINFSRPDKCTHCENIPHCRFISFSKLTNTHRTNAFHCAFELLKISTITWSKFN